MFLMTCSSNDEGMGESVYFPRTETTRLVLKVAQGSDATTEKTSNCPLKAALCLNSNRNHYLEAPKKKTDLAKEAVGRWRLGSTGIHGLDTGGRNLEG